MASMLVILGMGPNQPPSILEAQKFVLKDASGHERGSLFATESSWGLVLYNSDMSKGAAFVISPKLGSTAILMDKTGHGRIAAWANDEESNVNIADLKTSQTVVELKNNKQGSALVFRDGNETDRVSIGFMSGGQGGVLLNDANSITRTAISEDAAVTQFDAKGAFVWSAGWDGFSKDEQNKLREIMNKSLPHH